MGVSYLTRLELPSKCSGDLLTGQPGYQSEHIRREFHKNKRNNTCQELCTHYIIEGSPPNPMNGVALFQCFFFFFQVGFSIFEFMGMGPVLVYYISLYISLSIQQKITNAYYAQTNLLVFQPLQNLLSKLKHLVSNTNYIQIVNPTLACPVSPQAH